KGNQKATQIADIFTEGKLSLNIYTFKRLIGIVLGNQFSRSFPEILQIFFLPPVLQISIGIVPTPLVIKAMGDFMANNRSDASVVYRCISLVIIKRRLQDSRREYDF